MPRGMLPIVVARVVALGLVTGALLGCGGDPPTVDAAPELAPAKPVELLAVHSEAFTRTLLVAGIVEARTRIDLPFRVSGHVAAVHVDEGDRVEAGTVLAELDLEDLERRLRLAHAALDRARASAREARSDLARTRKLYATEATSTRSLEQAESTSRGADAARREAALQVELDQDRLAKGTLVAPVSGWIEARHLEAHEFAPADTPAFVLTVLDPVTVRAAAPDSRVADLARGASAVVRTSAQPGRELAGKVVRVALAADPESRTLPFEVEVPNPDLLLRPEMAVEVELRDSSGAAVQTVPLHAVLRDASLDPFCFVGAGEGERLVAERRTLVLGPLHGGRVTVLSGLAPGERVVVRGQHLLRPGDAIRTVSE